MSESCAGITALGLVLGYSPTQMEELWPKIGGKVIPATPQGIIDQLYAELGPPGKHGMWTWPTSR